MYRDLDGVTVSGKSFVYGAGTVKNNLWMMEGFAPKAGFFARLGLR